MEPFDKDELNDAELDRTAAAMEGSRGPGPPEGRGISRKCAPVVAARLDHLDSHPAAGGLRAAGAVCLRRDARQPPLAAAAARDRWPLPSRGLAPGPRTHPAHHPEVPMKRPMSATASEPRASASGPTKLLPFASEPRASASGPTKLLPFASEPRASASGPTKLRGRGLILWLVLYAARCLAQVSTGHELASGNAVLGSGETVEYKTLIEPPLSNSAFLPVGSGFHNAGNSIQHFVYDRGSRSYFGYRMAVTPGVTPNARQVTFGPLIESEMRDALKSVAGDLPLNPAPLPKYPAPQTVYDGDTIALDLMVSPDGRERIVDYIRLGFGAKPVKPPPAATAEPRDFTLDDGPVNFSTEPPQVRIDGAAFPGIVLMYGSKGGATVWFYFPGQGRYILSLAPHEGFARSGVLRANDISFRADGHEYQIHTPKPLAGTRQAWNLYVARDPQFLPRPALVKAVVGGADRLENLLPKP